MRSYIVPIVLGILGLILLILNVYLIISNYKCHVVLLSKKEKKSNNKYIIINTIGIVSSLVLLGMCVTQGIITFLQLQQ